MMPCFSRIGVPHSGQALSASNRPPCVRGCERLLVFIALLFLMKRDDSFRTRAADGGAACACVASCVMRRLTSDPSIAAIAHRLAMIVRASAAFTIRVRR
jgi:hypothetical protein